MKNNDDTRTPRPELPADDEDIHGGPSALDGAGGDAPRSAARYGPNDEDPGSSELTHLTGRGEDEDPQELVPPDLADLVARLTEERVEQSLAIASMSSGPLPTAPDLAQYQPDHQERIIRMAESVSTDESVRRDQVTQANIGTAKLALWSRNGMFAATLGLAFVSYMLWENPLFSALFLSLPVLQVVGSTIHSSVTGREPRPKGEK